MRLLPGVLVTVLLLIPRTSPAQTPARAPEESRIFVDLNLLGTASSTAKSREFTAKFIRSGEIGSMRATYPKPSRATLFPFSDVGGGVRLTRRIGVGVSYSRATSDDVAALAATIPHPTFFSAPASDARVAGGSLTREESAAHVFVALTPVRTHRAQMRLFGGPSFFRYHADMVQDVVYAQAYEPMAPTNVVTITGIASTEATGNGIGFHLGGDFTWFLTRMLGVAGGVRFSQANVTVDREPLSALRQEIRVGGTLAFLGLRVRFGG